MVMSCLLLSSGCQTAATARPKEPEVHARGQEEADKPDRHVSMRKRNLSRLANPKPKTQ